MDANTTLTLPQLLRVHRVAVLSREIELNLFALWGQRRTKALFSGLGAEVTGTLLAELLSENDYLLPRFRGCSAVLGKGVSPTKIVAEMMGLPEGLHHGTGGATGFFSLEHRIPYYSINLGANFSVATGLALGLTRKGQKEMVAVMFGDGEATRTPFPATLNLAALWSLPMLFVCEHNDCCDQMQVKNITAASPAAVASAYGIEAVVVADTDSQALCETFLKAVRTVRSGRPFLLEVHQYRHTQHSSGYHTSFSETAIDKRYDSLASFESYLLRCGVTNSEMREVAEAVSKETREIIQSLTPTDI